jgi:putative chitinase
MYTLELFQQLFPKTNVETLETFVGPLNDTANNYEISESPLREAAFIAQVGHESGDLRFTKENLNYSAESLMKVFRKYFNPQLAAQYARNPEMIANRVYGNRMGNGPEESGDGWKYRGRGLIQLTGKNNYSRLASAWELEMDILIDYLETPFGAAMSAGWFWDTNKLNRIADSQDFVLLTKRINGGTIGLEHRQKLYDKAMSLLT